MGVRELGFGRGRPCYLKRFARDDNRGDGAIFPQNNRAIPGTLPGAGAPVAHFAAGRRRAPLANGALTPKTVRRCVAPWRELMSVEQPQSPVPTAPALERRTLVALAGGGLLLAGAAAALAVRPRRADGLPAAANLAAARDIGDGFFLVDGWVLTADDLEALSVPARP